MNDINEMPPKCQYCPYWEVCEYPWVCPDREQLATDTISRKAAIDALRAMQTYKLFAGDDLLLIDQAGAQTELMMLPPAQPERKRGKWIYGEDEYGIDGYHCNQCGFFVSWDYAHKFINYIEDYHFCPHCGADMREVDDERPD